MNERSRNNTDNTITNLTDESKRDKMLETISGDNSKSFSPGSLSFYQRLVPWSMTIWDIQVSQYSSEYYKVTKLQINFYYNTQK